MIDNGSATLAPDSRHPGGFAITRIAEDRGISRDAVRRLIKAGKLSAHQVAGSHGPEWCVHPDEPPPLHNGSATPAATVAPDSRDGGATEAPGLEIMRAEAMAAYTRSVLEPLVQALERSERRARELTADNAELRATVAAQEARIATLGASGATQRPETPPWLSRFWGCSWAVYGAVGLLAVVVPVLAWVLLGLLR